MIQQTQEEKIAMYMKLSKKELIEMLLENQRVVDQLSQQPLQWVQPNNPAYPSPNWISPPMYPMVICGNPTTGTTTTYTSVGGYLIQAGTAKYST